MALTAVMLRKFVCTFSYGKIKGIFGGIRIKFHLGGQKVGVRRGMEEKPKMRVIFCKIPIIQLDTNFISQTVGQTNF